LDKGELYSRRKDTVRKSEKIETSKV